MPILCSTMCLPAYIYFFSFFFTTAKQLQFYHLHFKDKETTVSRKIRKFPSPVQVQNQICLTLLPLCLSLLQADACRRICLVHPGKESPQVTEALYSRFGGRAGSARTGFSLKDLRSFSENVKAMGLVTTVFIASLPGDACLMGAICWTVPLMAAQMQCLGFKKSEVFMKISKSFILSQCAGRPSD